MARPLAGGAAGPNDQGVEMGTKDKGGSKASKKPAQKDIKQKREAKRTKRAK
jgi:hypothetical protein